MDVRRLLGLAATAYAVAFVFIAAPGSTSSTAAQLAFGGQDIFRYDTFGDEQLWTDTLRLHEPLQGASPAVALSLGLKVDSRALPLTVQAAIRSGRVNLNDPAVTMQLIALNAVVGVVGQVSPDGTLESVGVTCALCHSTVDNSLADGIGRRLDGWPNRDLDVGRIIALSTQLSPAQRAAVLSWGPGKFDPRLQAFDGTGFIPLNTTTFPVLIPPAYGLRGVGFETYTGDGPISYWNNYVGVSQMGGHGNFEDPRIPLTILQPPPDLVTPKLPALLAYQLSLRAPAPSSRDFNPGAARRGEQIFNGIARCSGCHIPPLYTDVLRGGGPFLHSPSEVGQEPEYASRSVTGAYRTTPLRGAWQHPPYFHDGSAADLLAVVNHYDALFGLGLTDAQKADLVEFLKSL
jgi:mono/diheme cytochrome c family protein